MGNKNSSIFPEDLDAALRSIAEERKFRLRKETHYEANNRELTWTRGKHLYRIVFYYNEQDSLEISVVFYKDTFPVFPIFFSWCQNYVPLFPYIAKQNWKNMPNLPLNLSRNEYKQKVSDMINSIIS